MAGSAIPRFAVRATAARFRAVGMLSLVLAGCCCAQTIFWGSEGFVRNVDSKGEDWAGEFKMALGVFEQGFVPDPANRNEWPARWIELDLAESGDDGRRVSVIRDPAPLPENASTQVYLWASDQRDITKGPEWMLLTHSSWQWPQKDDAALPTVWIASDAEIVVAGEVDDGEVRLRSGRTVPVPESPTDWRERHFADFDVLPGWHEDADGDGLSQLVEYVLGTDPRSAEPTGALKLETDAGRMRVVLNRNPFADATFIGETSEDLIHWDPIGSAFEVIDDRPDQLEMIEKPGSTSNRRFVRFLYQIPDE